MSVSQLLKVFNFITFYDIVCECVCIFILLKIICPLTFYTRQLNSGCEFPENYT